jgi:hypothetical protein
VRNSYIWPRFFGRALSAALQGLCRDAGVQADSVELSAAVAAIVADPGLVARWAAGEPVFAARSKAP